MLSASIELANVAEQEGKPIPAKKQTRLDFKNIKRILPISFHVVIWLLTIYFFEYSNTNSFADRL